MAIIFADVFPDIQKLFDKSLDGTKTLRFGKTEYNFVPRTDGKIYLRSQQRWSSYESNSKLYNEYMDAVMNHNETSELTRHEKSMVRAFYKYCYSKFGTVIEQTAVFTTKVAEVTKTVTAVETQAKLLKALKKTNLVCPWYITIGGVKFPLIQQPENPFVELDNRVANARCRLADINNTLNDTDKTRKVERLEGRLTENIDVLEKRIGLVNEEIERIKPKEYELMYSGYMDSRDFHLFGKTINGPEVAKLILENTGVDVTPIAFQNGNWNMNNPAKECGYGSYSITPYDINEVMLFNGINVRADGPMPSKADLEKMAKIGSVFAALKIVENKVLFKVRTNKAQYKYLNEDSVDGKWNFRKIIDEIVNSMKALGY